jgi:hypothetical protein
MIYCSLEPGLLILEGLAPHDTSKAFSVVRSLILHKKMMDQTQVQIPMTKGYVERIYSALENIPIKNPPLASELRQYIVAVLAKMSSPPLPPAEFDGTCLEPDFTSEWIDEETKRIWLDCLTAAMFDDFTNDEIVLSSATWFRNNVPDAVRASNSRLCEHLEAEEHYWDMPVLTTELAWNALFSLLNGWPTGLDTCLIDSYAVQHLGITPDQIAERRKIRFSAPCYRDISRENDTDVRASVVDVIARRAFNCLMPENNDETITGQPGVRRVYVKKMAPPIRLHYTMSDESITFILYSNNDHHRGL